MESDRRSEIEHWLGGVFDSPVVCPKLERALMEVLGAMPEPDWEKLQKSNVVRILYGGVSYPSELYIRPRPVRYDPATFKTLDEDVPELECLKLLVLNGAIEEYSYDEAVAEVAHELGHIVLGHESHTETEEDTSEFDACALAAHWGFGRQIVDMVRRETCAEADHGPGWKYCVEHISELQQIANQQRIQSEQ